MRNGRNDPSPFVLPWILAHGRCCTIVVLSVGRCRCVVMAVTSRSNHVWWNIGSLMVDVSGCSEWGVYPFLKERIHTVLGMGITTHPPCSHLSSSAIAGRHHCCMVDGDQEGTQKHVGIQRALGADLGNGTVEPVDAKNLTRTRAGRWPVYLRVDAAGSGGLVWVTGRPTDCVEKTADARGWGCIVVGS